jgi:hypothetical protein
MNLKRATDRGEARVDNLHAVVDSYVNWRHETRAVAESYRSWRCAAAGERGAAFERYVAALDREERAACGYRRVLEQRHGIRGRSRT